MQHWAFASGPPRNYYLSRMTISFAIRNGIRRIGHRMAATESYLKLGEFKLEPTDLSQVFTWQMLERNLKVWTYSKLDVSSHSQVNLIFVWVKQQSQEICWKQSTCWCMSRKGPHAFLQYSRYPDTNSTLMQSMSLIIKYNSSTFNNYRVCSAMD